MCENMLLIFLKKPELSALLTKINWALLFFIRLKMRGCYDDYIKALTDVLAVEKQEDYDSSNILKK